MNIAVIALTTKAKKSAALIKDAIPGVDLVEATSGVRVAIEQCWRRYDALVCIMAAGIVVRCIAGLMRSKKQDPAVLVIDEKCRFVISLLSGHIGGGNVLAEEISRKCQGCAVVTTASDVAGHTALDLWIIENNFTIINPECLTGTTMKLIETGVLKICHDRQYLSGYPNDFVVVTEPADADVMIGLNPDPRLLCLKLVPRIYYVGIGCRRGTSEKELAMAWETLCAEEQLNPAAVAGLASVDLKKDERGLLDFAVSQKLPIRFFSKEELEKIAITDPSDRVMKNIGIPGVSEPAAVLAASTEKKRGIILVRKRKWEKVTATVAQTAFCSS